MASKRTAEVTRKTRETDITLTLDLDGSGQYEVATGIGMLDHLLESLARHALFDLFRPKATSTATPTTCSRTSASCSARRSTRRSATAAASPASPTRRSPWTNRSPLVVIDLGGRPYAAIDMPFIRDLVGELPTENIAHLLEAFAQEGRLNLHARVSGDNDHHIAEAVFKGLARCLRTAVAIDPRASGAIPSTKDVL